MLELLIGCKVIYLQDKTGIITDITKKENGNPRFWVVISDGEIVSCHTGQIRIHSDDIKFLDRLNRDYRNRKEAAEKILNRSEILDL